tara:strand:+ start:719 stop:910 length:192 start_codon:yes stop_codon:yes gene_type:complete
MAEFKKIRSNINNTASEGKQVELSLSKIEVEFLLNLIANSDFKGKDVQIVYETAVKLQQFLKP